MFAGSGLQQLDVSHNSLGTLGVELLLRSINPQKVTALDLGHTRSDSSPGHLALHLKPFLSQVSDGCWRAGGQFDAACTQHQLG